MQEILYYVGTMLISMICGFIAIPLIIKFCLKKNLYDFPNSRKLHHNPTPRLGGISFVPVMLLVFVFVLFLIDSGSNREIHISLWSVYFCIALFVIYFTGFVDDLIGLNATTKFVIETLAIILIPASNLYINNLYGLFGIYTIPYSAGAPLTVLVLVFCCNAINLIDGIDGLSGSLSFIALTGYLICFHIEHLTFYCVMIAALAGVLISYLYFNIFGSVAKQHKIFMGDSGSLSLGFILGFLAVKLSMNTPRMPYNPDRMVLAWTLLALPCLDVVRVFFFRILQGRSPFSPDKKHIHHKLIACGLSQHQALVCLIALQLLFIATNVILTDMVDPTITLLVDISMYAVFNTVINLATSHRKADAGNPQQTA
ncbi:glycosyltransferase family 4 protein [Hallella multisaccharivorax]|uniref:glycosyltransferase family 4 protein n=1 Tax=Hallella multisaccharivorax TaxID=310514 RepID=UPI003608CC6A